MPAGCNAARVPWQAAPHPCPAAVLAALAEDRGETADLYLPAASDGDDSDDGTCGAVPTMHEVLTAVTK